MMRMTLFLSNHNTVLVKVIIDSFWPMKTIYPSRMKINLLRKKICIFSVIRNRLRLLIRVNVQVPNIKN